MGETKQRNIKTEVSLIFGLPEQTLQSFKESIQFCKEHSVPTIYAYPLMLLRGTPLHSAKNELKLVESSDLNLDINRIQQNIPHVVSSPSFTFDDWCSMAALAEQLDQYNSEQTDLFNKTPTQKMQASLQSTVFWKKGEEVNLGEPFNYS